MLRDHLAQEVLALVSLRPAPEFGKLLGFLRKAHADAREGTLGDRRVGSRRVQLSAKFLHALQERFIVA